MDILLSSSTTIPSFLAQRNPHSKDQHPTGKYLRDAVYGGLDGIITTFGCVSGVEGAELSCWFALMLGLSKLVADGISMATCNYLGERTLFTSNTLML
jgi:VIT1/CCC1 family predicted Fe2+/Mn2+ transporter